MKTGSLYNSSIPFHTSNNTRCSLSKSEYKAGGANNNSGQLSDRDSVSGRSKRSRIRKGSNGSIKITRNMSKKKNLDFTDFAYREAVGRLKFLLAESYTSTKPALQYRRPLPDDSGEETDNQSQGTDRPALSEISKYMSPKYKTPRSLFKKTATTSKSFSPQNQSHYLSAKDYDTSSQNYQLVDPAPRPPPEILSFIEKQEDYIEQLEKESKFCRDELSNLLGKVRDVISENEALTEHARSDLVSHGAKMSASSESEDNHYDRFIRNRKEKSSIKSSHSLSGPNIIFESRISELEAELAQSNIDLKKIRSENEELKRKSASSGNLASSSESSKKQVDSLERDKIHLEETIRKLHQTIEDLRSEGNQVATKTQRNRDLADMAMFEKSQAEIEIRRLKDELERQHERIRELQHEMSRRVTEERANAERRYNYQVDQLGGDLSSQWEQASKLQLDVERQKRVESDLKRDLSQRNAQIEELKLELKDKKTNFLTDLAQLNAEKQSLEQEITSLRLQLERAERQSKIEAARLNAEINSLRQRLDRADADILHARRENLRLNDDIANLEKDVALGEMKGEIRPTTKDLNKTIMEMEQKHVGTVVELEEMIQSQRQLMDKLTKECKTLTNKLEETTLKQKMEISAVQSNVEFLTNRIISNDRLIKNDTYSHQPTTAAPIEYESPAITNTATTDHRMSPPDTGKRIYSPITKSSPHHEYSPTSYSSPKSRPVQPPPVVENYGNTYDYRDDENEKDRSTSKEYAEQLLAEDPKPYESEAYSTEQQPQLYSDQPDLQQYSQQQYQQPDYPETYDQQPYSGQEYGGTYNQSYDMSQYQGSQQQYDEYNPSEFDQTYQPETNQFTNNQQPVPNTNIPTTQPAALPGQISKPASGSIPLSTTQSAGLQQSATTIPTTMAPTAIAAPASATTEGNIQSRKSSNLMGLPSSRNGDKGSNLLSQQSPEAGKRMPATMARD